MSKTIHSKFDDVTKIINKLSKLNGDLPAFSANQIDCEILGSHGSKYEVKSLQCTLQPILTQRTVILNLSFAKP
jgi:hypothetical protein